MRHETTRAVIWSILALGVTIYSCTVYVLAVRFNPPKKETRREKDSHRRGREADGPQ